MTMKKKIFISNAAMVLISLLILFGIGSLSISLFKDEFMNVIEQNAELSDDTYAVMSLLKEEQQNPVSWDEVSRNLESYNFELYVTNTDLTEQYSNIRHSERECIEELEKTSISGEQIKLYSMEKVTIMKCLVNVNSIDYYVYAAYCPLDLTFLGMDRGMFEMFIIVFIIAGIIVIAGLFFCSQIFTRMMIKRIMMPVDELNNAAIRIKNGNFEEPIFYDQKDEFEEVCQTFNQMQYSLKKGIEQSERYEKARTEMITGISHDLRTPLTSVKAFIKGIMDGVASTPEKQKQYLSISYQKACDMEVLLQKLFFFSKLETGNMPFFIQKVDFGIWLKKYADGKQEEEQTGAYRMILEFEKTEYPVNIDVEQMKRVFDNLIENSIKYADAAELKLHIQMIKTEKTIRVEFKDNGIGMEEEKLPYVFDQFYRGDESRNSKNEGSGLGLYVCKYIIEEQKGTITAKVRQGFCVEIEIPLA